MKTFALADLETLPPSVELSLSTTRRVQLFHQACQQRRICLLDHMINTTTGHFHLLKKGIRLFPQTSLFTLIR